MFANLYRDFFFDFFHAFYYGALILSAFTILFFYRKTSGAFSVIGILLAVTIVSEIGAKYLAYNIGISNNVVYHFFTPVEFILYAIIYGHFLQSKEWRSILRYAVVLIVVAEIVNTWLFQSLNQTNTNIIILESVMLVLLSLRLFLRIAETAIIDKISTSGVFWFNCAVLIYYSFNILVWGFHSIKVYHLVNPPEIIYQLLLLLSGILYTIFSVVILLSIYYKPFKIKGNE